MLSEPSESTACHIQAPNKQTTEQPAKHDEKAGKCAKIEKANRAIRLDWHDDTFGQSVDTCGTAGIGVILAGGVFAFILSLVGIGSSLYSRALSGDSFLPVDGVITLGIVFCLLSVVAATLAQVFAMYLTAIFNLSLGFPIKARHQILITGGLAAFICLGWITAIAPNYGHHPDSWRLTAFKLLIVFAGMLHAHIGALWSARRYEMSDSFGLLWMERKVRSGQPKKLRLANLFWITLLCAVVFTIQRATSFPITLTVVTYVVLQTILIGVDAVWLGIRQQRHQLLNKSHANG